MVVRQPYMLSVTAVIKCWPECCCMWSNRRFQSTLRWTWVPTGISVWTKLTASAPRLVIRNTGMSLICKPLKLLKVAYNKSFLVNYSLYLIKLIFKVFLNCTSRSKEWCSITFVCFFKFKTCTVVSYLKNVWCRYFETFL